ncbi:MAG: endonuclease/exonuclease/phosphatase family protein, partial [Plesiomonas sp.]
MTFSVVSYNARGLSVGHSDGDSARRFIVDKLLEICDVMCIQETFLPRQDLERLNGVHKDFYGAGESTTDLNTKLVKGRIPGGVAVLWHKKYDNMVKVLRLGIDWAIGLEVQCGSSKFVILNIYTPYECPENEDKYINCLASVLTFIKD